MGNCKILLFEILYSLLSDFAGILLNIEYLTESWKKITFSGSCANQLLRYLFETLPVAIRFIRDHKGFLVEVSFRKGSEIRTILSRIEEI